jgi:hypothetical protein
MNGPNFDNPPASFLSGIIVIAHIRSLVTAYRTSSIEQLKITITECCEKHGFELFRVYAKTASGSVTKKDQHQFLEMINILRQPAQKLNKKSWSVRLAGRTRIRASVEKTLQPLKKDNYAAAM